MTTEIITTQQNQITPMAMLQLAVEKGASLEQMEKLMDLQERWEKNEARKAFNEALGAFKSEPIIINKDKQVSFGTTSYKHATLGNIGNTIGEALSKHGLSYRWATEQVDGKIVVTCHLMHKLGHSETVSLSSSADTSGGKNGIQAIGSAVSYLQRYTLLAITGMATQEQDDDGRTSYTVHDVMDEGVLCDKIAAIEACTTKAEIAKAYLSAIEQASALKDQEAMDRINVAKQTALDRVGGAK